MSLLKHTRCFIMLTLCMGLAWMASAAPQGSAGGMKPKVAPKRYPFDKSDRIQASIGNIHSQYFVGEPVVVPVVLSNHTKYPITLSTSFNPRSSMRVYIRPQGDRERKYNGPYQPGVYPPADFPLNPLEEINHNFMIWGDIENPTGLVFDKPGDYTVRMSIEVSVPEGGIKGEVNIGMFNVKVVPTPTHLVPLVEKLKRDQGFLYVHLRKTPITWGKTITQVIKQYSPSVFTPYLSYAAATYFVAVYHEKKDDKQASEEALKYYQIAAKSDSAYKMEAYMDLLTFMDELDMSAAAEQTAEEILRVMPHYMAGRIGEHPLVEKYLVNTKELSPKKYWSVLP